MYRCAIMSYCGIHFSPKHSYWRKPLMHAWSSLWGLQSQLVLRILLSGMIFTTRPACMVERKWLGFSNTICTVAACYDGWIATFYMYVECSPVSFTSQLFLTLFFRVCFPLASSPGPTRKLGKGPGHTCKTSRMYCVSTLFGVDKSSSPITFLTHEGSMLIPRPKWNLHRRPGLIHHMICATGCVFMSPGKNFCCVLP